jgi:uncharacterized protein
MSAGGVIDSLEFARGQEQLRGNLAVVDLKRLEDVLFDTQGSLDYELRGTRDARNRPQVEVKVAGQLHLLCQRCLDLLDHEVHVASRLVVVPKGARPDDDLNDPEAPDVIEAMPELEVAALVEEEVLLSLPLAPRHPEGECQGRLEKHDDASGAPSPFAQLGALKPPRRRNPGRT